MQRTVGFSGINLGRHAKAKFRQPAPSANDRHAAIITRGLHLHALFVFQRFGHEPD